MPEFYEYSRPSTEFGWEDNTEFEGQDDTIGLRPTLRSVILLSSRFTAPTIQHSQSTAIPKPTTRGAAADSFTERFSRDTQRDERDGDKTVQTAALEAVTRTGTVLLRDEEITKTIRAGKVGGDHLGPWRPTEYEMAIAAAEAEYKLSEYDHETAVNEAQDAGCTQRSVDNAKASAKPPASNDVENAASLYIQRERYPLPESVEGGSSGEIEGMEQ